MTCVAMVTTEEAHDDPAKGLRMIKEVGCYDYSIIPITQ